MRRPIRHDALSGARWGVLASVALLVLYAAPGEAQFDCLAFDPPLLFDTSGNPASSPSNPRSRGAEVFYWAGHPYLVHGTGNELEVFRVDDPENPVGGGGSSFDVPPWGDRDYNLFNFSVCDDCRFGAAGFDAQGLVLWDFGTGAQPSFTSSLRYPEAVAYGAFTFSYNNQQYLVAPVSSQCQGSALVTFDGIEPTGLGLVQCVTSVGGTPLTVDAGFWLDDTVAGDDVVGYVYLLDSSSRNVHMFSVRIQGGHPHLTPEGAVMQAVWILDHGFDIVEDPPAPWPPVAVSAEDGGLRVWDLSDPSAPELIFNMTLTYPSTATSVEVAYPYLYVGTMGTVADGSGHLFDVSNPYEPQEVDAGFWSTSQPWNAYGFMANQGGAFTADGEWLFLARSSVLERFHVECVVQPPVASFVVSPGVAFPGDTVTITNTTAGQYTTSAMWVTGASGFVMAGSGAMSSTTPPTLQFPVPLDLGESPYTAHVAVARPPEFPCDDPLGHPELCGGQISTGVLNVDSQPEAVLEILPAAPLTGDTLTLDGRATEGGPVSCSWEVLLDGSAPPLAAPDCSPWSMLGAYQVDASGEWTFRLTADYQHPAPMGGLWSHTTEQVLDISSVAAAFSVYPTQPVSTEDVILCSDSRAAAGASVSYSWELAEDPGFASLVTSASTCASGIAECGSRCGWVIDEAYLPDETRTYWASLTLSDLGTGDSSSFVDDLEVRAVVDASFTWSPAYPSVGDTVLFTIQGVSGALDSTRWDFGLPGCSPYTQSVTCTPGAFTSCLTQPYRYGQSGSSVPVRLWVTVGGVEHGPFTEYLTVGSGTCGGGTTCTYAISPTSASFAASGGNGSISVDASASSCSWTATSSSSWIHVTSGSSGTGDGTVAYSVDPYTGSSRSGSMTVAGRSFTVAQAGSGAASVDFTISDLTPEIGETVTFTASAACQTPEQWAMGGQSCDGQTAVDCSWNPSLCRTVTWRYKTSGTKTVNLSCAEGDSPPHFLTVQTTGSCSTCDKDGPPDASFTMTPNPALLGEPVTFTDTSSQGPKVLADFGWVPQSPDIGETVLFSISGVGSVTSAAWDFGASGCSPYTQTVTCTPSVFSDCLDQIYKYAAAGTHTVTLRINGGGAITHQVTVQNEGSCGGTTCTYSLNPTSASVGATAGSGIVAVTTQAGCTWTAQANSSWIHVTSGSSYVGSGTVSYSWDANTGSQRSGGMTIAGRSFTVTQAAGGGGGGGGYLPTAWEWTVRLVTQTVATSSQPSFAFTPTVAGEYTVTLRASNCAGSHSASQTLVVFGEPWPEGYMVPAVVHAPGYNNTVWRSDLRIFNPGMETVGFTLEYWERSNPDFVRYSFGELDANGTVVVEDVTNEFIPGDQQGSLRITFDGGDGTMPVVVSRTYNDVATGTYGQYVPAVPLMPPDEGYLYLPGLVHNAGYRTNLLLANLGSDPAGNIAIRILDTGGATVGAYTAGIPGSSSNLMVGIAELAGVTEPLDLFTVEVDAGGAAVHASASMIDQLTGDPVLYTANAGQLGGLFVPGVAHLPGALGSQWRSDLSLFNPTLETMTARVDFVPEDPLPFDYARVVPLAPQASATIRDILGDLVGSTANTKGYLRVRNTGGTVAPTVAARTYNQADGGTFGQKLHVYDQDTLVHAGETRYIPGVATGDPAGDGIGYRTNLGLTNTDEGSAAQVLVTLFAGLAGEVVGQIPYTLEPAQFVQFNPFSAAGLGSDFSAYGSIEVSVTQGGPVAAYASVVDNGTQDPILIPALVAY